MKVELYKYNHSSCQIINLGSIERGATFSVKDDAGHGMLQGTRIARRDAAALLRKGAALYVDLPSQDQGYDSIRIAE